MRRPPWSPGDPLWKNPDPLLLVRKMKEGWYPIDGIPQVTGSRKHNQFLMIGEGKRILSDLNKEFGILWRIGDHLGFDPNDWQWTRRFLGNLVGVFLHQFRDWVITVQVLPRRKTFRTLHANANPNLAQKLFYLQFPFHAACARHMHLPLAYDISVPGTGLFMGSEDDYKDLDHGDEEPFWTNVVVRRLLPGGQDNRESWFFIAYEKDRERIQRTGSVPVLETFFHNDTQESPLISFCAIHRSGTWLQTHCFSLDDESGKLLDIRQSQPTLEHHCRSAPHNHSGLGQLVCGERWK